MKLPQLHVGFGTQCGPATIFPVWAESPKTRGLVTGSDTKLVLQELPTPEVGRLTVTNLGAKAALLTEGQLLEGGLQHRIAEQTVLIGASETAVINVMCVEKGRWSGSAEHRSSGRRAPLQVHAGLHGTGTDRQSGVWHRVHRYEGSRTTSATGSLLDHVDQPRPQDIVLPNIVDGQRGVIIGFDGRVLSLELFGSHKLFRQHYPELMESMVPDLFLFNAPAGRGAPAIVRAQSARDFIGAIASNGFAFRDHAVRLSGNRAIPARRFEGNHPQLPLKGVSIEGTDGADPQIAHLIAWNGKHSMLA